MDALRRAEEAKRQANPNDHPAPSPRELSLDPLDAPTTPLRQPLPPLSRRLSTAESEPAPTTPLPRQRAAATAPADTASIESAERTGAKNLFAVKQLPRSRRGLWLFLGLGGMAMLVIAGYVWWQLQMMASASLTRPLPPPAPASTPPELPAGTAQQPTPTLAEAPLPRAALESPVLAAAPRARSTPAERMRREALPPAPAAGVFRPGGRQTRPDETLNLAYEAWQAGRLDEARRGYEEVCVAIPGTPTRSSVWRDCRPSGAVRACAGSLSAGARSRPRRRHRPGSADQSAWPRDTGRPKAA
jgi:hypothetical protein